MATGSPRKGYVRKAPVRSLLRAHVAGKLKEQAEQGKDAPGDYTALMHPRLRLAINARVNPDTLDNILSEKGANEYLDFDVADRLLCAIDRPLAWYTEPDLHAAYQETNLDCPSRIEPWEPQVEMRVCAHPECEESFETLLNYTKSSKVRRYCSQKCQLDANGQHSKGGKARAAMGNLSGEIREITKNSKGRFKGGRPVVAGHSANFQALNG
jgi:hypothetical protein